MTDDRLAAARELLEEHRPTVVPLGRVVATASVRLAMERNHDFEGFAFDSLRRHQRGDWGDVDDQDRGANDAAVAGGTRIVSVYRLPESLADVGPDNRLWIITEADRSATTVLWPSEY